MSSLGSFPFSSPFSVPGTVKIVRGPYQVAFGVGVHFCLGATLARNELRSLFSHLLPRLDTIEFDGIPMTSKTTFVGGHKTLPIRYTPR